MFLSVNDVKKHLNIDVTFRDDDAYISQLIQAAEKVVFKHIDDTIENVCEKVVYNEDGDEEGVDFEYFLPTPLKQATLLLIGNWYANRESISYGVPNKIPLSYEYLTQLYRKY